MDSLCYVKATHSKWQLSSREMVNFIEHRVAAGVDAFVLTYRVEFAPGRQRSEHLASMKIYALRVLILLGTSAGDPEGDRAAPSCILKNRHESQYFAGSDRCLRIMSSQISVL